MNNLFSSSWGRDHRSSSSGGTIQMINNNDTNTNLDKFFENVESIKEDLNQLELAHRSLRESNESLKTLHSPATVRDLRTRMDAEVSNSLKKAKLIKLKLESLDRSNASSRFVPGNGPGSSTDRARTSLVAGLRKKLRDQMEAFGDLRQRVAADHREAAGRRYYAVTGERADEATVEAMAAGELEGEGILKAAMEGRGAVEAAVAEMRERKGAVAELERSLIELHQVFMDMEVMVVDQGIQIDDIESQVGKASSFVEHGVGQLVQARRHQRNTRKWTFIGILILLIVVLVIVLPIVIKN